MFVTLTLVETLVRQTRKHDILDTKTAHHAEGTRNRGGGGQKTLRFFCISTHFIALRFYVISYMLFPIFVYL